MKTRFAAIFSLAGALLISPCVFGKELKDYNQGELKQAVQDVVDRLYTGYKEPFGTIMFTLGRSADNPWDGAGQSEKKPSDDTTPKPGGGGKGGTSKPTNIHDAVKNPQLKKVENTKKLTVGQQDLVNGFLFAHELKHLEGGKLDDQETIARSAYREIEFASGEAIPGSTDAKKGFRFKGIRGCSGQMFIYTDKASGKVSGEFLFVGSPNVSVKIDSEGNVSVENYSGDVDIPDDSGSETNDSDSSDTTW